MRGRGACRRTIDNELVRDARELGNVQRHEKGARRVTAHVHARAPTAKRASYLHALAARRPREREGDDRDSHRCSGTGGGRAAWVFRELRAPEESARASWYRRCAGRACLRRTRIRPSRGSGVLYDGLGACVLVAGAGWGLEDACPGVEIELRSPIAAALSARVAPLIAARGAPRLPRGSSPLAARAARRTILYN